MFNLTQTLLIIVVIVLTFILTAIGVQFFLLLKEARQSLKRANSILDSVDDLTMKLSHPAASVGNLLSGLKEGVSLIETIAGIFNSRKKEEQSYDEL